MHHKTLRTHLRRLLPALAPLLLGACASLGPDGGMAALQSTAKQQLQADVQAARTPQDQSLIAARVAELLQQPLSADTAVQLALLNNRGLQAGFQSLGLVEAELVQASRLPNPGLRLGRLKQGDEREIERTLGFDLGALISLPLRRKQEQQRLVATQRDVALQMLALAADTRKAFYLAVAAQQTAAYRHDAREAAQAAAELARRMQQAGNWSALDQAREQGFLAEARLGALQADLAQARARERLARLLGLPDAETFKLPERLPDLPTQVEARPSIEQQALQGRLDLQAARARLEASARGLGLSRVTRFVDALELDLKHNSASEAPRQTGFEIGFEIPLFDWGEARVARAEAQYLQDAHLAAQAVIEARSELREAYEGYRNAHEVARHYRDELLPLARRVSQEQLLRYNGMFIGVFELLADARTQIGTVSASIEALRDFWIARADLDLALVGRPALAPATTPAAPNVTRSAAH
ncbi:TolC family protein [Mitsuaria sp. WAJ17]|nr:TolC family protein [Mitsuaria sp. WAJ17]